MKYIMGLAAAGVMMAGMAMADPVFGTWKANPDDNGNYGHVKIGACGAKICGTLIKSFDSKGKTLKSKSTGKRVVWDMKPDGGGKYSGGKVYTPDRDKTYSGKMVLKGNVLNISGCVLGIRRSGGPMKRVN